MNNIKEYSSIFATKLAYIVDKYLGLNETGIISSVSAITTEKETTAKNWLFNGKIPRENKRLTIADRLGISYDYLFNDDIPINEIKKPEVFITDGQYYIPQLPDVDIKCIKKTDVLPVHGRVPVMLPSFDKIISKYGRNIYATQLQISSFAPYIDSGATVICSEKLIIEEYKFLLFQSSSGFKIKRIVNTGEKLQLVELVNGEEKINNIESLDEALLVILSFSF